MQMKQSEAILYSASAPFRIKALMHYEASRSLGRVMLFSAIMLPADALLQFGGWKAWTVVMLATGYSGFWHHRKAGELINKAQKADESAARAREKATKWRPARFDV